MKVSAPDAFKITPLTKNPGLYSESLGSLHSSHTTWTLITYIDTHGFTSRRRQIEENLEAANAFCYSLQGHCLTRGQLRNVQARLRNIANTEATLEELIPSIQLNSTEKRRKRAPLEFIGKISKILFGTMDSDDANRIDSQITALANSTVELAEIVQNQTHIIKSSFNFTQNQIISLAEAVKAELREIKLTQASLQHELYIIQRLITFTSLVDETLIQYEIDLETLINAVLFAKMGQIHPEVLSAKKILTCAEAIRKSTPNTIFPIPLSTQYVPELTKIMDLTAFHNGERLIYVIKIPLLDLTPYKLYQHLSVPVRQLSTAKGARFAYIKPAVQYTAVSEDFSSYFNLKNENECQFIANRYICKQNHPVGRISDETECEVQLLVNPQLSDLELCDIRLKTLKQTYWIKIRNANAWLFAAPKPETLYLLCDNHESAIETIENTGILQIKPTCQIKTRTITLTPSVEITSTIEVKLTHTPVLNITEMIRKSIKNVENINYTEIMAETETLTGLSNPGSIHDDLTKNEVALKAVIAKAREISKTHYISNRLSTLEKILKYSGISLSSIVLLLVVGWKFSLFGKISSLYKILSCVAKRQTTITQQATEAPEPTVVYHRQPIELIETQTQPTTDCREVAIITNHPPQPTRRPVYALTYHDWNRIP